MKDSLMRFVAVVVACVLTACGGDGETAPTSTVVTPSRSSGSSSAAVTQPDAGETAVIEAYDAYWEMVLRVNDPPNPADPEIAQWTTGNQLVTLVESLQRNAQEQTLVRLPENALYEHNPEIVSLGVDVAEIRDCSIDDGLVIQSATGEVLNDAVATHLIESTLKREAGAWKVAESTIVERWDGVAGCAQEL